MSLPVPIGETLPWYANEVKIFLSSITAFAIALLVTTIIVGHPTKTWIVSVGVLFVVYASFMIIVVIRGARYRRRWHAYEASVVAHAKVYEAIYGQDEIRQGRQVRATFHLSNGHAITQYADPFYDLRHGDTVAYRHRVVRGAVEIADLEIHRNQPAH